MDLPVTGYRRVRWAYGASIKTFLLADPQAVLGALVARSSGEVTTSDRIAWVDQIATLREALFAFTDRGSIYLEFDIPRLGKRVDAILVVDHALFVLEFKVGASSFSRSAINQVWDYALDLKYFHSASRLMPIVPILVATASTSVETFEHPEDADGVLPPVGCSGSTLSETLSRGLGATVGPTIDPADWEMGRYQPTPTIIEAARHLYAKHDVVEISRSDASAENLSSTTTCVMQIIERARTHKEKIICFVTGVPGAGKTLVGLDVATKQSGDSDDSHSVFLSGNGPLVAVLQEALTQDEVARARAAGEPISKDAAARKVKTFVQNVHHFRDEYLADKGPPANHVALFDEAQRAWDLSQTSAFMRTKKDQPNFHQSEPAFLISCMDRHDWAVVVCLVGGGQEINRGEAGITEWLSAVSSDFPDWVVYLSPNLALPGTTEADAISAMSEKVDVRNESSLHLATSIRSFRSEHVSGFVNDLLGLRLNQARRALETVTPSYPIFLTRDVVSAKRWLRARARGNERFGMVVSSGAQRLRPLGVDVRVKIDPVQWFLRDHDDVRSSYYLEDAATEFQVQGLELDWACVVWDADLRLEGEYWGFHKFSGSSWKKVNDIARRRYLLNAYRVLLTRARQGMVIVVPEGSEKDWTRPPKYYQGVFDLLKNIGVPLLN